MRPPPPLGSWEAEPYRVPWITHHACRSGLPPESRGSVFPQEGFPCRQPSHDVVPTSSSSGSTLRPPLPPCPGGPRGAVSRPVTSEQTPHGFALLRIRLAALGSAPGEPLVAMKATGTD